ncbi:MAG: hypothetical protein OQL16_00125 [Gammaproteobacteria bacterium]|nr:hypothetical protein [Gammaproteobacteria bacterium]
MTTPTGTPPEAQVSADDLKRIAELASLYAAAQDALTDDMVSRLASAMSEGITLLDRMTRNEGLMRLLQVLDHPDVQCHLISLADSVGKITREMATAPPSKGGLTGILKLAMEPGTQEGLRAMSIVGKHWGEGLRELHRIGGKKNR